MGINGRQAASAGALTCTARLYVPGVTAILLAGGFYLTCRKPRAAGKTGLWLATTFVVLLAAAPPTTACPIRRS